ncbi:transglutaminase family protein [Streptomyces alfalfae]
MATAVRGRGPAPRPRPAAPADRRGDGPLARPGGDRQGAAAARPARRAGRARQRRKPPRARAAAVGELLTGRYGFRGGPGDYQRLEPSLPHRVPRRRGGSPILLSALWLEVALRAGRHGPRGGAAGPLRGRLRTP